VPVAKATYTAQQLVATHNNGTEQGFFQDLYRPQWKNKSFSLKKISFHNEI